MRRAKPALDLLLIFLLAAVLVRPLFKLKYLYRWDSIESTFIADGRFLSSHLPHPQWQPLWYCGTRFDYLYPPVIRYGTALLSLIWIPAKAYHIFTALLYCLGIAGVYFFVWVASRSRGAAWLAAAASALISPALAIVPWKSPFSAPWHLWILTAYGEGPHVLSVALMPFALGFAWLALEKRHAGFISAAAICCALVPLTNFYGAVALAIFYPILVWSLWVTHRDNGVWLRAAAIALLAYGLAAFWLTPSYLSITLRNLVLVAPPGKLLSRILLAAVTMLFVWLSLLIASRKPGRAYAVFLAGSLLFFGLNVLGYFYFGFAVMGQPHRWLSEFDLVLTLAVAELVHRLWVWPVRLPGRVWITRAVAMLIILFAFWPARHYIRHAWQLYPPASDYRQRVEYRMSDWMATHFREARTFVTGSVRFWWDTWHDLAQVAGGSDQGVENSRVMATIWEVLVGNKPEPAVEWLMAMGADAIVVSDSRSQEMYHDYKSPGKFAGVLPVLYDDGQGNVIYRVPRRYASLARVVDRAALDSAERLDLTNLDWLRPYTAVIESGPDSPAITNWAGPDALHVHARVTAGQSILVQETYDPGWHACAAGHALPVRKDRCTDFMVIDAPPGEYDIALHFEMPLENRIGWVLMGLSLTICAAGLFRVRRWLPRGP